MVREEYIGTYEKQTRKVDEGLGADEGPGAAKARGMVEFANISIDPKTATKQSEIDEYLRLPVENVTDPLKWWFDKRRVYPNLSRMALDYLSIPGMYFHYHSQLLY